MRGRALGPQKILAWLVHLYTASGAVLSAWAILAIFGGDFRLAWLLIFATIFIDSTDGVLARRARVGEVLPDFDGRRLDDIVDYIGWVFVPILLLIETGILPAWAAAPPLLASGYGFSQAEAKTEDYYFLGWPSYWSILAFVLFEFRASRAVGIAAVLFCSVMVFVPIRYPYPTRTPTLRGLTILLGLPWAAIGVALVLLLPERPRWLAILFCYYPVYYVLLTIYLSWQRRRDEGAAGTRQNSGTDPPHGRPVR
jgi:phosphatidylcholine synthase